MKITARHNYTGSISEATKQAIQKAKEKYTSNGKAKVLHYDNNGVEFDYTISGNAIEICLSPKHQAKSANKGLHLALAEHIDEVINKSVEVEEHPDYIIKGKDGIRGAAINPNAIMHRFYGLAIIDGIPCRIMTLLREDIRSEESNGIHSYEVQKIEVLDNELPSTSNGVGTQINDLSAYPLAKLINGVEKSYDKGKNLLEESEKHSDSLREQRVYGHTRSFCIWDTSHTKQIIKTPDSFGLLLCSFPHIRSKQLRSCARHGFRASENEKDDFRFGSSYGNGCLCYGICKHTQGRGCNHQPRHRTHAHRLSRQVLQWNSRLQLHRVLPHHQRKGMAKGVLQALRSQEKLPQINSLQQKQQTVGLSRNQCRQWTHSSWKRFAGKCLQEQRNSRLLRQDGHHRESAKRHLYHPHRRTKQEGGHQVNHTDISSGVLNKNIQYAHFLHEPYIPTIGKQARCTIFQLTHTHIVLHYVLQQTLFPDFITFLPH